MVRLELEQERAETEGRKRAEAACRAKAAAEQAAVNKATAEKTTTEKTAKRERQRLEEERVMEVRRRLKLAKTANAEAEQRAAEVRGRRGAGAAEADHRVRETQARVSWVERELEDAQVDIAELRISRAESWSEKKKKARATNTESEMSEKLQVVPATRPAEKGCANCTWSGEECRRFATGRHKACVACHTKKTKCRSLEEEAAGEEKPAKKRRRTDTVT